MRLDDEPAVPAPAPVAASPMDFDAFSDQFRPLERTKTANGNPILYETYGEELQAVQRQCESDITKVWTLVTGDDDEMYVVPGFHHINRMSYLITEVSWTDESLCIPY